MGKVDCIYLAAGVGQRVRLGYTKMIWRLGGKLLFLHGLEVLRSMSEIGKIVIACPPGLRDDFVSICNSYSIGQCICIEGGSTRQESVKKALSYVWTDRVLVAEGARPFITREFVRSVLEVGAPSVTPWMPSRSSVVYAAPPITMPPRESVGEVQTPQAFNTKTLRQAHDEAGNGKYTCDAHQVFCVTGVYPTLVPGLEQNFKITTPIDLVIAEALYESRHHGSE